MGATTTTAAASASPTLAQEFESAFASIWTAIEAPFKTLATLFYGAFKAGGQAVTKDVLADIPAAVTWLKGAAQDIATAVVSDPTFDADLADWNFAAAALQLLKDLVAQFPSLANAATSGLKSAVSSALQDGFDTAQANLAATPAAAAAPSPTPAS